jgi:hypothetical protein
MLGAGIFEPRWNWNFDAAPNKIDAIPAQEISEFANSRRAERPARQSATTVLVKGP